MAPALIQPADSSAADAALVLRRHNVRLSGSGRRTLLFAHGFGCDQTMWQWVAPAFERDCRVALFDYVGHGDSDHAAWDPARYATLEGFADDVLQVCRALGSGPVVFVGHSVSAMIGALAAIRTPALFEKLVMIGPSPCYIDCEGYVGGFSRQDVDDLLDMLDSNYLGWSSTMAPVIMANADRPELSAELENRFCRTDPAIARQFARVTFDSDNRDDLPRVPVPALVLQCRDDVIAPRAVGEYVHARLPDSRLVYLDATGHCPNVSAPAETIAAIRDFL